MKILFWDVETAPMVVATWGLYKQDIWYDHIISDWYIICASWKWIDKNKVDSISVLDNPNEDFKNDYPVIKELHNVLGKADVVVAHNGDKFDLKKFNTRALYYNLTPLDVRTVDTLKEARKHFQLSSNRLDFIGQYLGVGRKLETVPKLWLRALAGDMLAIKSMIRYNKQDVLLLEKVYHKLRGYMSSHPNWNLFKCDGNVCPNCGSERIIKDGFRITRSGKYQRYLCGECGRSASSGHATMRVDVR